ncbi:hypothetical protein EVAR_17035_1 [Eumeta japonica]|uniref:Uncharacterized protein n=1 Tax=Eumeta variegata TaxID=151549 RepID=A0A4C1V549_EUMVA|nr:hypothetical protein EVAR_17035_1 [Eumeta japonica]
MEHDESGEGIFAARASKAMVGKSGDVRELFTFLLLAVCEILSKTFQFGVCQISAFGFQYPLSRRSTSLPISGRKWSRFQIRPCRPDAGYLEKSPAHVFTSFEFRKSLSDGRHICTTSRYPGPHRRV